MNPQDSHPQGMNHAQQDSHPQGMNNAQQSSHPKGMARCVGVVARVVRACDVTKRTFAVNCGRHASSRPAIVLPSVAALL